MLPCVPTCTIAVSAAEARLRMQRVCDHSCEDDWSPCCIHFVKSLVAFGRMRSNRRGWCTRTDGKPRVCTQRLVDLLAASCICTTNSSNRTMLR